MSGGGGGGAGGAGGGMPSFSTPSYDPAAEYRAGIDALKADKFKEAEAHFNRVTEAAPRNADVWYVLGLARAGKGDLKGAEKAYEKSVKLAPDNINAHRELGVTLAKLNLADKAKAELDMLQQKATACGDSCPDAADLKSAVSAVQTAMSPNPRPSAELSPPSLLFSSPADGDHAYVQAVSLINERRYQEALTALNQAARTFGPHPDVLTYLGYTYRKMGQFDQAETYYREALQVAPHHRGATEYYGELKVERGDMTSAKRLLADLDNQCAFGCIEAETLRRWIELGHDPNS
jgi:Flp pilus assembly protein TadD